MPSNLVRFRFYGELNDLLAVDRRQVDFDYAFTGNPSIKDAVEAVGVPHTEVDLILVDGVSVGWEYHLAAGNQVSVYPVFEATDIAPVVRLRPAPLRVPRFAVDVHLGRLARWLRLLGFDASYDSRPGKAQLIDIAAREHRAILTRDRGLLKNRQVTRGYWVRATDPRLQVEEVVQRFHLRGWFAPFSRCMECNGTVVAQTLAQVVARVPPKALERATTFHRCSDCGRVYWDGTHVARLRLLVDELSA